LANCNDIVRDIVRVAEVLVVCERQPEQEYKEIKWEILVMKI
jgi:hypothetical protein